MSEQGEDRREAYRKVPGENELAFSKETRLESVAAQPHRRHDLLCFLPFVEPAGFL